MASKQSISSFAFKNVQELPNQFYKKSTQPKMKFGSPQVNKEGSYKMREITRPIYSLKILLKEINHLLQTITLPDCMYGGIEERNSIENAFQHRNSKYFLTIDLKKFFRNITNSRVHQTLVGAGFTWCEARNMTNLATYKGSLPQGAPTSTTLANLVFAPTALLLEKFCKERNIIFTVFVDDLTFSAPKCLERYKNQILEIIQKNGFFVNHNKIHCRKNSCEITGIIVRRGKLLLPKEILDHQKKAGVKEYIAAVARQYNMYKKIADSVSVI